MTPLSVVIITLNEAHQIARCLESVQSVADEIVILDSHSTDETVSIAQHMGAIVFQQPFLGYIEQKNKALALAKHDWVLCLDADEALSPELILSIQEVKKAPKVKGYSMNRCTSYCGTFIKHGSWYPDRKLRLFDKSVAAWGGVNPHDKVEFNTPQKTQWLKGDLLHYSYHTLEEHIQQNNRFSTIAAKAYFDRGKKASMVKMLLNPCWAFLNSFIVRQGFRDGFLGFVIAKNIAHMTFMKYYKLRALEKGIPLK